MKIRYCLGIPGPLNTVRIVGTRRQIKVDLCHHKRRRNCTQCSIVYHYNPLIEVGTGRDSDTFSNIKIKDYITLVHHSYVISVTDWFKMLSFNL